MSVAHPLDIKLNNGVHMPVLGFGTFESKGEPGKTQKAVETALNAGYRHLDCAWIYENEEEVGAGIKKFLDANPSVKRSDLFITTKVWNHLHEPEDVEWSLNESLKHLQLDYVDCFLIHWPIATERDEAYEEREDSSENVIIKTELMENPKPTWQAMEKVYKAGKARSIGVSNWSIEGLEAIRKYAEIQPAVNQVEIHAFFPNRELVQYCFAHDIMPVAYSPLGSQQTKTEPLLDNHKLLEIAKRNNASVAQVLIAWALQGGWVVVPKSSNDERIKNNFSLIHLNSEEFAAVDKVGDGKHKRFVNAKDELGIDLWPEDSK